MKTLKHFILYIICCIYSSNTILANDVKYIEIRKVDFEIETVIHIDCDLFDNYFKGNKRIILIYDKSKISVLTKLIEGLKKCNNNYVPDVRAKLLIHYEDKINIICMDGGTLMINDSFFIVTDELVNYINKLESDFLYKTIIFLTFFNIRLISII